LDLAEGGDDDTDDNEGDVSEGLQGRRCNTESPGREKNGDWRGGL
jgi:hypothetical protein